MFVAQIQQLKMADTKLKYNIQAKVSLLPREIRISDLLKVLEKHGIVKGTFYRDSKVKSDSDFSIPTDRLQIYAKVFGCSLDELMNHGVEKIKSIHQELLSKKGKKKIKSGLA
jgi:hypothetical protein